MQIFSKKFSWSSSSNSSTLLLLFGVYSQILTCTVNAVIKLPTNITFPAVIVFGDSIVDPGNNNNLQTLTKCNFPPYGRDFKGGIPTGRFGNGRVPSDMIAEELGIKQLVPAYLDPNLQPNDLITGVSFASGGSGFDPLTPKIASALSLTDQLKYFKEYIEKLNKLVGVERTKFLLANSIFLVLAGSDDIANTYFLTHAREAQYDVPSYTNLMVDFASSFVKQLYTLGARRIGVFSAPPLGCLPSQRTVAGGIQRQCAEKYNQAAMLYNSKLSSKLNSLNNDLLQAKLVYIDIYTPLLDVIQNYRKFGFEVANKGCCGTGNIEVIILCNRHSPHTCADASRYVFWDSYHPTQRAYEILTGKVLTKYVSRFF